MSQQADWDPTARLLTIEEAAASIHRPPSTIRRWISQGTLTVTARYGHRPLILEAHLLAAEATIHRRNRR